MAMLVYTPLILAGCWFQAEKYHSNGDHHPNTSGKITQTIDEVLKAKFV